MKTPPKSWQPYLERAKRLLENKKVKAPLFSRGTYQIEVEKAYPLIHLDEEGNLLDAFCSCEHSEGCEHLLAGYKRIFLGQEKPLHVRFLGSFWKSLFEIAASRVGWAPSEFKEKEEGTFSAKGVFLQIKTKEAQKGFSEVFHPLSAENEETSLKFSNWSSEEMQLYKIGKAPFSLLFELSYWSDLAKWALALQEEAEPYEVHFEETGRFPNKVRVKFRAFELEVELDEEELLSLIPTLKTVEANLGVRTVGASTVVEVVYEESSSMLHLTHQSQEKGLLEGACPLGIWQYVQGKGFFLEEEKAKLLEKEWIPKEQLPRVFEEYPVLFQRFLSIYTEEKPFQFALYFDETKRFFIETFLFEKGDLLEKGASLFDGWAYLPGKGFFKTETPPFEAALKVIEPHEMADFINTHRLWLQLFTSFQTHVGTVETKMEYRVDPERNLTFQTLLDLPQETKGLLTFDPWIYLPGQGFYMQSAYTGKIPSNAVIPREEVASFIAEHKEELEQVRGFFSSEPLLKELGLALRLNEESRIVIEPKANYLEGIDPLSVIDYQNVIYVDGKGFYEIPLSQRVPEKFQQRVVLAKEKEAPFLAYEWEMLRPFLVECDPRLMEPQDLQLTIQGIEKKRGRYRLKLVYTSELGEVCPFEVWEELSKKGHHAFSEVGLLLLRQARFQWMKALTKRKFDVSRQWITIDPLEWIYLQALEKVEAPEDPKERALFLEMSEMKPQREIDLSALQSTLRPYQEEGVLWLWFLYCHGLSGLLCDDMGLGKTHQAMALLSGVSQEDLERKNKYLIACPTSVIYHWEALLKRFLPSLHVCVYYGLERSLENFEEESDILLTSYGILRTSQEKLKPWCFDLAIFDEVQIAKNHTSQTHKILQKIKAKMRLGLTGTPIENRIRELKALFDVVLPSYMPSETIFRDLFIVPIEKEGDQKTKQMLHRLVQPFVLRRKKTEVLHDLPSKIEEIAYCDLSNVQKELYREMAKQGKGFLEDLKDPSKPVPYLHIFSVLSSLKQICDHPALYYKDPKGLHKYPSGKWDLFVELLEEARGSGQKIVIFSQYLDMIAMIERYLKEEGIGYASIKGSTKDRKEQLEKFQEDPACEVFVASLLAAGVGIDLTAGSVVIHYDRWWNPAKENQATDRVHRIGQSRGVQVFKLVTKNTIEEEINLLIEKKKHLLEDVVLAEDQVKILSREELIEVFEKLLTDE